MRTLKLFIWASLVLATCFQSRTLAYEYRIYNNKSGFEEDFIYTLVQDQQNFLWIGTINGLYRFDGFTFQRFTTKDGLAENNIVSSFIDKKGLLYFGHIQGKVSVYDGRKFRVYDLSDKWKPQVVSFAEGSDQVAALTRSKGIFIFNEQGGVSQVQMDFFKDRVRTGIVDFRNRIYVAHNEGLSEVNVEGETTEATDLPELENHAVAALVKSRLSNLLLILTDEKGVFSMDSTGQVRQVISPKHLPPSLEICYEDRFGCIWVGSKSYGLMKFRPAQYGGSYVVDNALNLNAGFPTNQVSAIIQDHEDNYWIGSYDKGLVYIRKKTVEYYQKNVIGFEEINAVIGYETDQFLVGGNKGLSAIRYNPFLNKWTANREKWMENFDLPVTSLHQGKEALLVGTESDGIFRIKGKEIIPVNSAGQLKNQRIRKITEDEYGNLWVSASGSGIYRIGTDGTAVNFSTRTGFIHNEVYDLCVDKRNSLWIAMHANGLSVMNDSSKFIHLTKNGYLSARDINAIAEDRLGFIWVATDGQGIYKFNHKFQLIENYTVENGLLSDYCSFIIPDDDYIWASYYQGIDRIDLKDGSVHNFYHHPQNEFTTVNNTAAINQNGDLLIASIEGFNIISSRPEPRLKTSYSLNFTSLEVMEKPVDLSEIPAFLSTDNQLSLSYEENQLTFSYLTVGFSEPDQTLYSYRLNGSESGWSTPSNQRSVTFSSLSPGAYFFEIRSFPANDPEKFQYAGVKFKIGKPFYQQIWFILLVIFSGGGASVFYSRYKTHRIISQKRELENLVIQRTRLINAQKEEILKTNNELKTAQSEIISKNNQLVSLNNRLEKLVEERTSRLKVALDELDTFLYHASHDLKGPIARIKGLTMLSEMENRSIGRIETIEMMKNEGEQLDKTIDKLAKIHAVLSGKVQSSRLNFYEAAQQVITKLSGMENFEKIVWQHEYARHLEIYCDSDLLEIILENLLENAIVFQNTCMDQPNRIKIEFEKQTGRQIFRVWDNGFGMQPDILGQIFGMYFRGSVHSKGNGLGLYLVKKSVDKLRGKISVSSKPGQSTTFTITIPDAN